MRTQAEIQRAHDELLGLIMNRIPVELNAQELRQMGQLASVLCWVLEHGCTDVFEVYLAEVEKRAAAVGFQMAPADELVVREVHWPGW